MSSTETIVALATPPGVGAIGVIRLSGPEAIAIVDQDFRSKDLLAQASHTAHFGTLRNEAGKVIDEVLLTIFRAPTSYTKENVVEVSCHGSQYIIQELIELFLRRGARLAKPGEFTLRAFLNGQMDLSQAEAVADLIAADSAGAHQLALRQMRGGFSQEIQHLRQELIDFAALIELELDFGEEDVEFANRTDLRNLIEKIQGLIRDLIHSFRLGNVIKNGVNTVIAGRPNAGKSTLLNALLREERAIVSAIAGTTRDVIEEVLNIRGIQFRLTDTAGIRDAQDQIEAIGVERTFEKIAQSALLVYVFDLSTITATELAADLQQLQREGLPMLAVGNKLDQVTEQDTTTKLAAEHPEVNFLFVSAAERTNIDQLEDRLYQLVAAGELNLGSTVVTNARHYEALRESDAALQRVLESMSTGISADFIAMDIRQSLYHLGEITGEISSDDLLDSIFSRFCIGK